MTCSNVMYCSWEDLWLENHTSRDRCPLCAKSIFWSSHRRSVSKKVSHLVSLPSFYILTVSLAASKAGAAAKGIPLWKHYAEVAGNPVPYTLPVPCFNVINGGEHAGNKLAFQEFFVIPTGAADFTESMISK